MEIKITSYYNFYQAKLNEQRLSLGLNVLPEGLDGVLRRVLSSFMSLML